MTKELFEAQVQLLQEHNLVVKEYSTYDHAEVAKWSARQEIEAITKHFHASEKDEEETIGETKLRGPADETEDVQVSGEAAENLPYVSLPDTAMEGDKKIRVRW